MRSRIDNTCRGCTERRPACHDHCDRYQKAKKEWDEYREEVKHNKRLAIEIELYQKRVIARQMRANDKRRATR